ncbi:Dihydrolipoyllysine-residue succinyltransferase component of 2-oxoglutarate dehydrogenase complex, partial [Dysosmobacter welbionis]
AAAGVHCPGSGRGPGGDPGRRAHRRPGLPHRAGGADHAAAAPCRGQHGGAHHPRQLHRCPGPADHPAGGRPRDLR